MYSDEQLLKFEAEEFSLSRPKLYEYIYNKGKVDVIDEFVEYLKEYMWWSTQADENVVGEFALGEYAITFKDMLRRKND